MNEMKKVLNVKLYNLKKTKGAWYAGAFEQNGALIKEFVFRKRGESFTISDNNIVLYHNFKYSKSFKTIIWGGFVLPHYGHFLLESLTRYNAIIKTTVPILFFSKSNTIPSWVDEIFEILGISNRIVIIPQDCVVHVENFTISRAGYELETDFYTQEFFESLKLYNHKNDSYLYKRIWLSRAKLKKRYIIDEDLLEKRLLNLGWIIVSPEMLSVKEQVSIFTSAHRVAGFIGSAFHSVILAKSISAKLDLFLLTENININYTNIAKAKKLNQSIHDIGLRSITGEKFNKSTWEISSFSINKILDILSIENSATTKK